MGLVLFVRDLTMIEGGVLYFIGNSSQSQEWEQPAGMAVSVVSVLEIYSGARSRLAQKLAKNLLLECTTLDLGEKIWRRSIVVMERYAPALGLMAPDCL